MKKYKINKDNKKILPSDKKMEAKKDFGKLFHEYENFTKRPKKPMYKNPKYFLFLFIIVLIAYILTEYF